MSYLHYPEINFFIDYLRYEKRYSQHTIVSYQTDLEQFFQYLVSQFDSPVLPEISSSFIRSWLAEMKEEKIGAKTLNRKISVLRSFFKYQLKLGLITQNPTTSIAVPKISKRLPSFVSEKEMDKLETDLQFPDTWKGNTDKLLISIFYNTGMRLSELVSLKERQIDIANNQLKVLGKGNKERIIPISVELISAIKEYIQTKQKLFEQIKYPELFIGEKGQPLYTKYVYRVVTANLSGITTLQKKSPHVLRHTFATHLSNNGADLNAIKELLGHSSLAATQIYTHNTIDKLKDIHKKAHPKA